MNCDNPCKTLNRSMSQAGFSCNWATRLIGSTPAITGSWNSSSNKEIINWYNVLRAWIVDQRCPIDFTYAVDMSIKENRFNASVAVTLKYIQDNRVQYSDAEAIPRAIDHMYDNVHDVYILMRRPGGISESTVQFTGSARNYGPKDITVQLPRRRAAADNTL